MNSGELKISWARQDGIYVAVAYDLQDQKIIHLFTDYSFFLSSDKALKENTVSGVIYDLKAFFEFLYRHRYDIESLSDLILMEFRDEELEIVFKSANSSESPKARQRTVNKKLISVYRFLWWLQDNEQLFNGILGPANCPVKSVKPRDLAYAQRSKLSSNRESYPLLIRGAGDSSRRGTQYHATEEDTALLPLLFHQTCSDHAAQRNILIMELANELAWRRGSINSLTCEQFSKLDFESSHSDSFIVVPPSQKFGYEREFEVPFRLAFRVSEFIATFRRDLIKKKGWPEGRSQGRIFISEKTGEPLSDRYLSMMFSKAFKAIGCQSRGAALHSLRRKSANDKIDAELQGRRELGLDTSEQSVVAAVAFSMGHTNPESLGPYVNQRTSRMVRQREKIKDNQLQKMEQEIADLKLELANLRKKDNE